MAERCLVFVHIPKTAGATLSRVLRRHYDRSRTINFATLDRPLRDFDELPLAVRARAELVRGHVHYGVHRFLPQESQYITVLREPTKRALSLYGYILREERHPLHEHLVNTRMGFEEFIESGFDKDQVENGQTRQIAGIQEGDPGEDDLRTALKNLDSFLAVGITERFDESLILMKEILGWRTPFYTSRHVSPGAGNVRPEVSERGVALVKQKNELDLRLYAEVVRRLDDLIAHQGESFKHRVDQFQRVNRFASFMGKGVATIARAPFLKPLRITRRHSSP